MARRHVLSWWHVGGFLSPCVFCKKTSTAPWCINGYYCAIGTDRFGRRPYRNFIIPSYGAERLMCLGHGVSPMVTSRPSSFATVEAFLEGIVLFVILLAVFQQAQTCYGDYRMALFFYGSLPIFVDFSECRMRQLGFMALDWVTMDRYCQPPMIIAGALLFYYANKKTAWSNIRITWQNPYRR